MAASVLSVRKKLFFTLVVVGSVVLLSAAVAEGMLRARYPSVAAITGVTAWETGSFGEITYHWDRYHPRWGWSNLPGYRSDASVPFAVTINSQGLRGAVDYAPEPAAGITRIAVIGDSCTFGEEVDDDGTVPYLLERQLPGTEVLNFGVHGFGPGQMLLRLEEEVFDYSPDLVVVLYLTLGLFRDSAPEFVHPKPVFRLVEGELQVDNVPVPELTRQPWWVRNSYLGARLAGRATLVPEQITVEENLPLMRTILRRMRAAGEARDVPVLLVHIADPNTLDQLGQDSMRELVEAIRSVVRQADPQALDLLPDLAAAYAQEGPELSMPQGHWSPRGNARIAGRIAERLCADGGVEGCVP